MFSGAEKMRVGAEILKETLRALRAVGLRTVAGEVSLNGNLTYGGEKC